MTSKKKYGKIAWYAPVSLTLNTTGKATPRTKAKRPVYVLIPQYAPVSLTLSTAKTTGKAIARTKVTDKHQK